MQLLAKFRIQWIKNIFWHFPKSLYYNKIYNYPSKKLILIGITGTDGKTTTASLVHKALLESGINAGLICTLGAKIGDRDINVGLHTTSPDSSVVQKLLRQMVDAGLTHAVIEVTAHALDQYRYYGCHFNISAITNTSHEHLDDFQNINKYIKIKAKLFRYSDIAILNKDDQSYKIISKLIKIPIISYSIEEKSDYQATQVLLSKNNLTFTVNQTNFKTNSVFLHQVYNILAAHIILQKLNFKPDLILSVIKNFPEIKGRREEVKNKLQIKTIIDFAHTPAALKSILQSLRSTTENKLIVIFGATGGRDPSKRPFMGKVVSDIADIAIITADDTRNESVNSINSQIISGINQKRVEQKLFSYHNIPNRQDAFNLAIKLANKGDTVVACGKGHETTILHGKTEYPWSEAEAFRTAFRSNK